MWELSNGNSTVNSKFRPGNFVKIDKEEYDSIECYSAVKTFLRLAERYKVREINDLLTLHPNLRKATFFFENKLETENFKFKSFKKAVKCLKNNDFSRLCDFSSHALNELLQLNSHFKSPHFVDPITSYLIKDYRHIISSSAFRRLQDKAQVFSLEARDFVRSRLTHSLEVSSTGEDIASCIDFYEIFKDQNKFINHNYINEECKLIIRCACLIHDVGNPPFGHFGEDVINNFFKSKKNKNVISNIRNNELINDLCNFDGNAQSLRIVNKLQHFSNSCGLNLPASILGAIIKYPFSSRNSNDINGKLGYFQTEKKLIDMIRVFGTFIDYNRNPLSLIVEAADDISYITSDIEDAIHKKYISLDSFTSMSKSESKLCQDFYTKIEKFYKQCRTENLTSTFAFEESMRVILMDLRNDLILEASKAFKDLKHIIINEGIAVTEKKDGKFELLKGYSNSNILVPNYIFKYKELLEELNKIMINVYKQEDVVITEISGKSALEYLLNEFYIAILDDHTIEDKDLRRYVNKNNKYFDKLLSLISKDFFKSHINEIEGVTSIEYKEYYKMRLIIDYISGMTDSYAVDLYHKLRGK